MDAHGSEADWPPEDGGFTAGLIKRKAKRLVYGAGLSPSELDEVEQQLTVDLWVGSFSFDPSRGSWRAFATTTVKHAARKIVRRQRAVKRDQRRCQSLNVGAGGPTSDPTEFEEVVTEADANRRLGIAPLPPSVCVDLAMDVPAVTSTLPECDRQVVELFATYSKSDVIRTTGIKRSTLNDRLRKLRARLVRTGLRDYF